MSDKYLLISTDTHAGLPPEQYREYIDPQYRPAFDEALAADVTAAALVSEDDHQKFLAEWNSEIGDHGGMEGAWDATIRTKEMDAEGVAAEVVFPDADAAGVVGSRRPPSAPGSARPGTATRCW